MPQRSLRVLVVEDEMLVAMLIEDMLVELGHLVVGPAMKLSTALELATDAALDIAILDVNLNDLKSFPVADILTARAIPFVFSTGYGRKGVDAQYQYALVLDKPFELKDLRTAIDTLLA